MAHFAKIENGIVSQVIVISNDAILDDEGNESETLGAEFCSQTFGGEWVQTSFNSNLRGKYAGLGDIWDGKNFLVQIE